MDLTQTPSVGTILNQASLDGSVSDLALNEEQNELYFVGSNGNVSILNLTTNAITVLANSLFEATDFVLSDDQEIALHYDTTRGLLYAVGRDHNSTTKNSMYVIEVKSGDYARVANNQ